MTRVRISAGILLLLLGLSIFSGWWVDRRCSELLRRTDTVEQLYSSGDLAGAVSEAEKMQSEWESFRQKAKVVLKNNKLTEIDRLCSRIVHLTNCGSDEVPAEIEEFRHLLRDLKSSETPRFNNIF